MVNSFVEGVEEEAELVLHLIWWQLCNILIFGVFYSISLSVYKITILLSMFTIHVKIISYAITVEKVTL